MKKAETEITVVRRVAEPDVNAVVALVRELAAYEQASEQCRLTPVGLLPHWQESADRLERSPTGFFDHFGGRQGRRGERHRAAVQRRDHHDRGVGVPGGR